MNSSLAEAVNRLGPIGLTLLVQVTVVLAIALALMWVSLAQRWIAVLYWPQPLIHVLNESLSRAREELCDNHVLAATSPTVYAKTLLRLTERAADAWGLAASLSLISPRWSLEDRIAGILRPNRSRRTRAGWWTAGVVLPVLSIAAVLAGGIVVGHEADFGTQHARQGEPDESQVVAMNTAIAEATTSQPNPQARPIAALPQPESGKEERQHRADELASECRSLAQRGLMSPDPCIAFDSTLMLLSSGTEGEVYHWTLYYVNDRAWSRRPNESIRQFVRRLEREAAERTDETAANLQQAAEEYEGLSENSWPLDWRPRREMFLELFRLIFQTHAGQATGEQWQAAARAYPNDFHLFMTAYLVSLRKSNDAELDRRWVRTVIEDERYWQRQLRWDTLLLTTLLIRQVPADDPLRVETFERLIKSMSAHQDDVGDSHHKLYRTYGELYRTAENLMTPEAHVLLKTLIGLDRPDVFRPFLKCAADSPHYGRELVEAYLAKPVRLAGGKTSLTEQLRKLADRVVFRVWIDQSVVDRDIEVTPQVTDGPWLYVVESLLEGTPFSLHSMEADGVLWIGPQAGFEQARRLFERGFTKAQQADGRLLPMRLHERVGVDFINVPLSEIPGFLHDQKKISVEVLGLGDELVTLRRADVPLHLLLTRIMDCIGGDWLGVGSTVLVGSREQIAAFQHRQLLRNRRAAQFVMSNEPLVDALGQQLTVGCAEMPAKDVARQLADQCGIPMTVDPAHGDRPVSIRKDQIRLDLALDMTAVKLGLSWETDGQAIFMGETAAMDRMRDRWAPSDVTEIARPRPDPSLGDPFSDPAMRPGGPADPFAGPAVGDPFAKSNARPATEGQAEIGKEQRQVLSQQQIRLLEEALQHHEHVLNRSERDACFLDSALMLLNAAIEMDDVRYDRRPASVLATLAQWDWQELEKVSVRDFLLDSSQKSRKRLDENAERSGQLKREFAEISDAPWPLEWKTRQEPWLELVELMMLTVSGKNVNKRWREALDRAELPLSIYRMAHLFSIRQNENAAADYDMVKPLFLEARSWDEAVQWSAETLNFIITSGAATTYPPRVQARAELFKRLQVWKDGSHQPWQPLSELWQICRARNAPEAVLLAETLLAHAPYYHFRRIADRSGLSDSSIRAYSLAKPVTTPLGKGTLAENLAFLLDEVGLRAYIDPEVTARHGSLPVPAFRGPWLAVMEAMLDPTEYRLSWFDDQTAWIGRPERIETAREQYLDSLAKTVRADGYASMGLHDDTRMEFKLVPMADCVEFLGHLHDLPIELLAGFDKPVTVFMKGAPLHLALTRITEMTDLAWCARREMILIGTEEQIREVSNLEVSHLRRWSRIALMDAPVTRVLRDDTHVKLKEATLSEFAAHLAEKHKVPVQFSSEHAAIVLSLRVQSLCLEDAIDLICLKAGIPWSTDGQAIYLGRSPD